MAASHSRTRSRLSSIIPTGTPRPGAKRRAPGGVAARPAARATARVRGGRWRAQDVRVRAGTYPPPRAGRPFNHAGPLAPLPACAPRPGVARRDSPCRPCVRACVRVARAEKQRSRWQACCTTASTAHCGRRHSACCWGASSHGRSRRFCFLLACCPGPQPDGSQVASRVRAPHRQVARAGPAVAGAPPGDHQ